MSHQSQQLRADQIDALKLAYSKIDNRKCGIITKQQLSQLFIDIGIAMTPTELSQVFKQMDQNKNDAIEECEFMEYMKKLKKNFSLEKYTARIFGYIAQGDKVGKAQFWSFVRSIEPTLTKNQFENMWFQLDQDKDGMIDLKQFTEVLAGPPQAKK